MRLYGTFVCIIKFLLLLNKEVYISNMVPGRYVWISFTKINKSGVSILKLWIPIIKKWCIITETSQLLISKDSDNKIDFII